MGIATQEVRQRAIAAYQAGGVTQSQVASLYGVDISTFERWWRRYRRTGETAPFPRGHRKAVYRGDGLKRLEGFLKKQPDATLEQMRQATGKNCSIMAVQRAVIKLDWRFKKKRYEPVSKAGPT